MQQFFIHITWFYPNRPDPIFWKLPDPEPTCIFPTRHNTIFNDLVPNQGERYEMEVSHKIIAILYLP